MRVHIDDILKSDLLERYVMGDITKEERMQVDLLRIEHRAIREKLEALELALEKSAMESAVAAPAKAKECIIRKISDQVPDPILAVEPSSSGFLSNIWKYAALLAVGVLGTWMLMQDRNNTLSAANNNLNAELSLLEERCASLSQQYAFINDSSTLPVLLEGSAAAPESQVVIYWNEMKGQSMIKVIELPAIRANETYQLWADVDGQMLSLGVFDAALAISDPIPMGYLANAESLNITIEPKGGSEHPTVSRLTASQTI